MDQSTNQEHFQQAYHNATQLDPVGFSVFVVLALALLAVRRSSATLPILLVLSLLSLKLRVVVGGLDFSFLRLLLVVGAVRVAARGEWKGLRLHALDYTIIASIVYGLAMSALREPDRIITRAGNIFDALGLYLLCRVLVRGFRDLDQFGKYLAWTAIAIAPFFLIEWQTGINHFSVLGGTDPLSYVHHGRMRAKGSYAHMLIAGCFWATLVPLVVARWWNPAASRMLVVAGTLGSLAVVVGTASSTPILGLAAGLFAAGLFPARAHLRWIRWGSFLFIVALDLAMNAPVWHLISRIGVFGGSTGWHRFNLIDKYFEHIGEWWLMGTSYTGHWGHNLVDITNVFVLQGVRGGLVAMLLHIAALTLAFQYVGRLIRAAEGRTTQLAMAWGLGVALFTHTVVQFAISFYGEILFAFYVTLAAIASLAPLGVKAPASPRPARARPARAVPPASAPVPAREAETKRPAPARGDLHPALRSLTDAE